MRQREIHPPFSLEKQIYALWQEIKQLEYCKSYAYTRWFNLSWKFYALAWENMEIASKKVPVILPIYNVADYLDKSLNSVATQSHRNLQIICVVDGATDNSAEIWKK